jgi:hypothetical protein
VGGQPGGVGPAVGVGYLNCHTTLICH